MLAVHSTLSMSNWEIHVSDDISFTQIAYIKHKSIRTTINEVRANQICCCCCFLLTSSLCMFSLSIWHHHDFHFISFIKFISIIRIIFRSRAASFLFVYKSTWASMRLQCSQCSQCSYCYCLSCALWSFTTRFVKSLVIIPPKQTKKKKKKLIIDIITSLRFFFMCLSVVWTFFF